MEHNNCAADSYNLRNKLSWATLVEHQISIRLHKCLLNTHSFMGFPVKQV